MKNLKYLPVNQLPFYFQKLSTQHRKYEVSKMIAKVAQRKGRLDLPIVSGKHLRKISYSITGNRAGLSGGILFE